MSTTLEHVAEILDRADISFDLDIDAGLLRTVWMRNEVPVSLLVLLFESGELVQLRAPALLRATSDETKPLLFRAMLQMAYEMRLVQFEYDPADGEVATCIDIALEDAALTDRQLLRCCSALLEVSFLARDRLKTILETGRDPALDAADMDPEETEQRQSQLDAMNELAKRTRGSGGEA
jgi:hypothetical protein